MKIKVDRNSLTAYLEAIENGLIENNEAIVLACVNILQPVSCELIERNTGLRHQNVSARLNKLRYDLCHIKGETKGYILLYRLIQPGEAPDIREESKQDRQIRELTNKIEAMKYQHNNLQLNYEQCKIDSSSFKGLYEHTLAELENLNHKHLELATDHEANKIENVLPFRDGKDEDDEKHVHPLQLDVIDRLV